MPTRARLGLGLAFVLAAATMYVLAGRWLDSRIFTPLDYPVSLENQKLKSPPFRINLKETYSASLALDYSSDDWYADNRCNYKTILYPEWRVFRLDRSAGMQRELWVSSEQLNRNKEFSAASEYRFHDFDASPGLYQLEWDIATVAPCLNNRHPRLTIATGAASYFEGVRSARLFCLFLGGTGLALVAIGSARASRQTRENPAALRIFPDMVLRSVTSIGRHAPSRLMQSLPHWGLFSGSILWILVFIFMILTPRVPTGILVPLTAPKFVAGKASAWPESILVHVGPRSRFFVNGEEVERNSLRNKLLEHRQLPWAIYFEADRDVLYMDAVYAIDTIQGCGAKVIWITPKMRKEWEQEASVRAPAVAREGVPAAKGALAKKER